MRTIKKKDIKKYKTTKKTNPKNEDGENAIDELVNGSGGSISGDEKNVNNSEIKVAPQQTGDQYADVAIQPNRLHFNVGAVGAAGNSISTGDNISDNYDIAKKKMIGLLENMGSSIFMSDTNDNNLNDINELPKNVARKLIDLIDSVEHMNLDIEKEKIILNLVNNSLKKLINKDG